VLVVVRASDLRSVRLATKFMSKTATNCRRKRQHSRRFRQLCCRFRFRRLYLRQQFVAVSGDYSRRKRQQSVAVSGYYVAVSGNNVAVFGDYSFGNNLLPFSATLLLVWTGLNPAAVHCWIITWVTVCGRVNHLCM